MLVAMRFAVVMVGFVLVACMVMIGVVMTLMAMVMAIPFVVLFGSDRRGRLTAARETSYAQAQHGDQGQRQDES
jgi:hypothetical protein